MVTELPLDTDVSLPARVPDDDPRTEVGQVGAAFNRMLQHAESALERRAASETRLCRFAADASHELRTPLAAIRGYADLALRQGGPVPADVTHALRRVESESARMSMLVDELLLLARLDAGRPLEQEPVDLTRLTIEATSDAQVEPVTPLAAGTTGRAADGPRRRVSAAPGPGQPAEQRRQAHDARYDDHRRRFRSALRRGRRCGHSGPGGWAASGWACSGPAASGWACSGPAASGWACSGPAASGWACSGPAACRRAASGSAERHRQRPGHPA